MIIDSFNNKIYVVENDIYLKLESENYSRLLGRLDSEDKSLITHRIYNKHLYRNTNSFGFNLKLLETATKFNTIRLTTDKNEKFKIPIEFILRNGEYLHFKNQGFEKQIFLTVDLMQEFKT